MTPMDIISSFNEKLEFNNNNYNNQHTPIRTSNNINNANLNPISETKNKLEEDDFKFSPKRSMSKKFSSPRKFNNNQQNSHEISEKEKRTILEHYRKLYSFKNPSPIKNSPSQKNKKNISSFPLISNNDGQNIKKLNCLQDNVNDKINFGSSKNINNFKTTSLFYESKNQISNEADENFYSTQKNSMFRSSIYSNLMPSGKNGFKKKRNISLNNLRSSEKESEANSSITKFSKNKGKSKPSHTTYGPFLHIDNNFDKKIEIKNPEIKRSLEDINYYGPYFSHCPICRYKNLDFYQTMEPHQCLKLLSFIKQKRSNIYVK